MINGLIARSKELWIRRKVLVAGVILLVGSGGVLGAARYSKRSPTIPTFDVKRGEFIDSAQFRGEIKAMKSVTISAPAEAGDLQIVKIVADGAQVKQGDMVVEFDKTKTEQDLAQDRSALKSAQAEIEQARAQARLTEEEDLTAAMKARFDVETAKLDASKQEIVSKIEGAEAELKVADAEQKLHEVEEKLKSDRAMNKATIESKTQASKKAAYDVQRAEQALTKMTLLAPSPGTISLVPTWRSGGESTFKPGDRAWPGAPIAELPDVSSLRVSARADESERGRLALKEAVNAQLDAIPDRQFTGQIEQISTIASIDFSGGWPFPRNFDLEIALDQADARLKPGMTAQLTVVVDRVPDALTIPVQASFQKSGQTVAYVWQGSKFQEHVIEIGRRNRDRILVAKGLSPGDRVALKDPSVKE
ncbi:MAG TPA: HlyD family efflux transporter periplasmic adaptor subunit [Terriglobales bacterium]|jgi:HlyD family secretion protein|nr:HlyD family efflux transporter periplasmic adaptor subunit [Terriglobales bacterium]